MVHDLHQKLYSRQVRYTYVYRYDFTKSLPKDGGSLEIFSHLIVVMKYLFTGTVLIGRNMTLRVRTRSGTCPGTY